MTNPNYTAIMLLVDRSGSMHSIQSSAEDGINEFISAQKAADGKRTIRVAQFDDQYTAVHASLPAVDVPKFTLSPRGMTALLDAMGKSIVAFGEELAAMNEGDRPGTVIFAVMTDGGENSSEEYTWDQVQKMVRNQEDQYGWQVLYLGANQDAIQVGSRLGVSTDRSLTYAANSAGTRSGIQSMNHYVATASSGMRAAFSVEDRENAVQDDD